MNKANIKCPRCHSSELSKFGYDMQANQKYQCKKCRRQFAPDSIKSISKHSRHPRCPRCGRATYLHHKYNHYNRYKCGNRSCNHILVQYHNMNIADTSSNKLIGSVSMKGMRFPLNTILTALSLYFLNNSSTRMISQFLSISQGIKVSHVTIASWTTKFAPLFKLKADDLKEKLNLESDDWHADETVVFIGGERYYLWLAIDSETRFVLAFHLTKSRAESSAFSLINQAKEFGEPMNFITDRLPSYNEPAKLFKKAKHIAVKPMSSIVTNNLIESFNKTFKAWYKTKKGFNDFNKANSLIFMFIFHYNFIRVHGSLNHNTPAEVAGLKTDFKSKASWFIAA